VYSTDKVETILRSTVVQSRLYVVIFYRTRISSCCKFPVLLYVGQKLRKLIGSWKSNGRKTRMLFFES